MSTQTIRYAQMGSPLIHAVPMTLGLLRPLCGGGWNSAIDPRDLFEPGAQVWTERSEDRCPTCERRHPPLDEGKRPVHHGEGEAPAPVHREEGKGR